MKKKWHCILFQVGIKSKQFLACDVPAKHVWLTTCWHQHWRKWWASPPGEFSSLEGVYVSFQLLDRDYEATIKFTFQNNLFSCLRAYYFWISIQNYCFASNLVHIHSLYFLTLKHKEATMLGFLINWYKYVWSTSRVKDYQIYDRGSGNRKGISF